jgi:CHAT domain-containing protein
MILASGEHNFVLFHRKTLNYAIFPAASEMQFNSIQRCLCASLLLWSLLSPGAAQARWLQSGASSGTSAQVQQSDEVKDALKLYLEGKRQFELGTSVSLRQAIRKFEAALALMRKIGDHYAEGLTLSYLGKVHNALGEKQQALDAYNQSLPLLREAKDERGEAATLNNIGLIHDALGDKRKALDYYNRALPVLRATKDRSSEAITLSNIGLAFDSLGEKQKALNYLQQALAIMRDLKDHADEAITLNNLGYIYNSLGEKDKALDQFALAWPIFEALDDVHNQAITYNNIGWVYEARDEKEKALKFYQGALAVLHDAGDRFTEGVTLNNIGLVYHALGQYEKALDYFTQALTLRQAIGDRPREALTLADAGMVYDALGQTTKALDYYNESLRLSRAVEDRSVEASTLRRLALLEEKRGHLAEARAQIEASLSIIESLRTRISAQELRDSYFAAVQEHFETYISLLMRLHRQEPTKGYDALALQASERARARGMLEMLAEAHADIRQGVAPQLLERERALQQRLTVLAERQTRIFTQQQQQTLEDVSALKQELADTLSEYQQVEALIRSSSPRYAALTQPVPLGLKEIQQQTLDDDTVLLEYALGDEKSYLWAVTPTSMKSFELPPRAEIESAAVLVHQLLTARNQQIRFETPNEKRSRVERADRDYAQAAARLSQLVLAPVASQLAQKRLLIVGDGALNYIPFAALPAPGAPSAEKYRPLVLEHEVVALPSASTLAVLRRETAGRAPAPKTLAVIADPVFDKNDERVRASRNDKQPPNGGLRSVTFVKGTDTPDEEAARIQRLPFTRTEANEILKLVPATASKKAALDFDASRATAVSPQLGQYRYVHFATHGILNSEHPELSGLVLSLVNRDGTEQDGFLWTHELFNLRLPVEMVVLSGCRTGLGKEIRGEGIVGMTRGFMYAGASRVMVSLWDISDEASAELMTHLYKEMLGPEHLRPAAALRAAQLAIWKDPRWQAPYYWAAFTLQGETK